MFALFKHHVYWGVLPTVEVRSKELSETFRQKILAASDSGKGFKEVTNGLFHCTGWTSSALPRIQESWKGIVRPIMVIFLVHGWIVCFFFFCFHAYKTHIPNNKLISSCFAWFVAVTLTVTEDDI